MGEAVSPDQILLVSDQGLFRGQLLGLINAQPDLEAVGLAGTGQEILTTAYDLDPDLILIDIQLQKIDGLEVTRLIRKVLPDTRILLLTIHDDNEKLFEAIKAGVNDFILKDTSSADFLSGLRRALKGEATLPRRLAAPLLDEFARMANQLDPAANIEMKPDLTPREQEVLDLLASGAANLEIAAQLTISIHTVKSHVHNILSKMDVVNRRQAARAAAQLGLLSGNVEVGLHRGSLNQEGPVESPSPD